jgi:hypothetical protein
MAGEGMDSGASDTFSRSELAKVQQGDLALAAASFNEMKAKLATLEAQQLQQATVREPPKSMARANKPQPFRGHGVTMHLGSWISSFTNISGGDQYGSESVGRTW